MADAPRPPTPDGVPLLGHGLAFARDPFGSIEAWASEAGVVRLTFPGRSLYLVTEPALVEEVLVERHDAFTLGRQQLETFDGVEDDAVTATSGDRWRRLRRALQPAFTWDGIQAYGPRMAERVARDVDRWADGEELALLRSMRHLTLHVLGDTLLGVDLEGREAVVLAAADALVDRADPRRFGQVLPDWVPTPTERRFERRVAALDDFVASIVADSDPGNSDVCAVLLAAHERGDLSMAAVEDNLTALLLAGHDSAAVTLTYAWYELSRHPDVRSRLADEVEAVVGTGLPESEEYEALERTRNVLRETLRLYPPAWAVNREAARRVTLGGYELPAGAQLMIPLWALHRDERFWDDPETFDPARWTRDVDRPEYAYAPFSGGPRHCIGMRFARLELTMALTTMLGRIRLEVTADGPLTFAPSLSLRPETELSATVRRP